MDFQFFSSGPINQNVLNLFWKFLIRRIQIKLILFRQCGENRIGKAAFVGAGLPSHNLNGSCCKA